MEIRFSISTTNFLIGLNIILFFFSWTLGGILGGQLGSLEALDLLGADNFLAIRDGEVWRLVTSTFLHANFLHLAFNMYALFSFGGYFENRYGGKKLFILYIVAGIVGSFISVFWEGVKIYLLDLNTVTIGVGASGALFGILGFLVFRNDTYIDKQRLYLILGINLLIGFMYPNIDNLAHLGGLFSGMFLGILDERTRFDIDNKISYRLAQLIFSLSFIALFISIFFKIFIQ